MRAWTYSGLMLDLGVDLDAWPWIWLSIAVVFIIIEVTILGGSFILLPFGVSAFFAAICGFYDVPIEGQWAVFVLGGAAMFVGFYRWAKRFLRDNVLPPGVGADRMVGMVGVITVGLAPDDPARPGRVSVEGETWGAMTADDEVLPEGTRVRITSMLGARLVVRPLDAGSDAAEGHP